MGGVRVWSGREGARGLRGRSRGLLAAAFRASLSEGEPCPSSGAPIPSPTWLLSRELPVYVTHPSWAEGCKLCGGGRSCFEVSGA